MFTYGLLLIRTFLTMMMMNLFFCIDGQWNSCWEREQSSLCFCRSSYRRSSISDLFLSQLSLNECSYDSRGIRICRQARLYPTVQHITDLVPNLINQTHCFETKHCLSTSIQQQRCQQCEISANVLRTENTSYVISTTRTDPPTDSCFYLCEHDRSCGFICIDRRVTMKIHCDRCRGRKKNITCRCMKEKSSTSCSSSVFDTTTPRWMQKRGFPAAGILGLLVLVTILLIIAGKLINRRMNVLARRDANAVRRSIATITTYRSRQPSPSTALSFPNTPLIPPIHSRKEAIATNTMVELLSAKSQEYVVDIHRHVEEDELSVFLLEKTSPIHDQLDDILDIDGDEDDEDTNQK